MKSKIIIFTILLNFCTIAMASQSSSFLEDGKTWWYCVTNAVDPYSKNMIKDQIGFTIQGKTTLNSKEWSCLKIIDNNGRTIDVPICFLKEENGKIYSIVNREGFRDGNFSAAMLGQLVYDNLAYNLSFKFKYFDTDNDLPLYDFTLEKGDPFDFQGVSRRFVVEENSAYNNGHLFKTFKFQRTKLLDDTITVYDGIGVTSGRIGFFFAPFECMSHDIRGLDINPPVLTYVTDEKGNVIYSNTIYSKYFPNPLEKTTKQ